MASVTASSRQCSHADVQSHLDNDVVITMKAGDVCVQRGTIHAWINPFDKPARVYFVLTGKGPTPIPLHANICSGPTTRTWRKEIRADRLQRRRNGIWRTLRCQNSFNSHRSPFHSSSRATLHLHTAATAHSACTYYPPAQHAASP